MGRQHKRVVSATFGVPPLNQRLISLIINRRYHVDGRSHFSVTSLSVRLFNRHVFRCKRNILKSVARPLMNIVRGNESSQCMNGS